MFKVGKVLMQQHLRGGMSLHLHVAFKDEVRCQTNTVIFIHSQTFVPITIAGNILRKPSSPLEPPPAASLGDSSHLLKCQREGEKKEVWHCLPAYLLMWIIRSCNNITAAICCCTEAGTTAVSRQSDTKERCGKVTSFAKTVNDKQQRSDQRPCPPAEAEPDPKTLLSWRESNFCFDSA